MSKVACKSHAAANQFWFLCVVVVVVVVAVGPQCRRKIQTSQNEVSQSVQRKVK